MNILISENQYDKAEILVHSIEGAAGNIGAEELQDRALELERWFKEGDKGLPEGIFREFGRELDRVNVSLSSMEENRTETGHRILPPLTEKEKSELRRVFRTILNLLRESNAGALERIEGARSRVNTAADRPANGSTFSRKRRRTPFAAAKSLSAV